MINVHKIKKIGVLTLMPMITTILFYVGLIVLNSFLFALGFMFIGVAISYFVGNALMRNPFSDLLDGKGLLAIDISSTGILKPFIMQVQDSYLVSNKGHRPIKDVFDRNAIHQLQAPKKINSKAEVTEDAINIKISKEEYNDGRFALFHYPVILYDSQIESIITKNFLSSQERSVFAEHNILFLNRKMEELTSILRDFGRTVVDLLKPKPEFFNNWLVWVILVLVFGAAAYFFAPSILAAFGSVSEGAAQATSDAAGGIIRTR